MKHDTVYCVGGLKFTGEILDVSYTVFSSMKWLKLKTKSGNIIINADHIISIVYATTKGGKN